jgi:hypothetical protein
MKNADMPAMPILNDMGAPHFSGDIALTNNNCFGLTKREMFAMNAMQALVTAQPHWGMEFNEIAEIAVQHADALLQELEK